MRGVDRDANWICDILDGTAQLNALIKNLSPAFSGFAVFYLAENRSKAYTASIACHRKRPRKRKVDSHSGSAEEVECWIIGNNLGYRAFLRAPRNRTPRNVRMFLDVFFPRSIFYQCFEHCRSLDRIRAKIRSCLQLLLRGRGLRAWICLSDGRYLGTNTLKKPSNILVVKALLPTGGDSLEVRT